MPRPALSASRSIDILDFLATFPGRPFSLSEIAKAVKINAASCHAIVNALTGRGYLTRLPQRTYILGPSLVAVGEAALAGQPLVARATKAAEELSRELAVPTLLTAMIGDEIVCIAANQSPDGRRGGLLPGERIPLVPPVGAPFLAWSDDDVIDEWIARAQAATGEGIAAESRHMLAITRERGFQVTLRSGSGQGIAEMLAAMASNRRMPDYKEEIARLINASDLHLAQPETIEPEVLYDIILIAAPLFNGDGEVAYNLCLGGFPDGLAGAAILDHADRLVRTCLRIMREDRGEP